LKLTFHVLLPLQITNLAAEGSSPDEFSGSQLCITLRPATSCSTLSAFCHNGGSGTCNTAFFDESISCCPLEHPSNSLAPGKRRQMAAKTVKQRIAARKVAAGMGRSK
jgi:hypothetical protein